MSRAFSHLLSTSAVTFLAVMSASIAHADVTKDQCIDADTRAQSFRRAGKLAVAREALRLCTAPSCPRVVQDDCTRRLDELDAAQPSVVFDAKDLDGGDLRDVQVSVDGQVVTTTLDGTALPLDPGAHTFVFRVAGEPPKALAVVVKEAEKNRRLTVTLGTPRPVPTVTAKDPPSLRPPPPPPPPPRPVERSSAATIASASLVGSGVLGIGLGAVFAALASSKWSSAKTECGSPASCNDYAGAVTDHDTSVTEATVSTVAFIAGGALVAGGAAVYLFTAPGELAHGARAARVRLAPSVVPGAAGIDLAGEF